MARIQPGRASAGVGVTTRCCACSTRSRLGGSQRSRIKTPYLVGMPRHKPQTPPNARERCRSNARGLATVQGAHSPDGEGDVFVAPEQVMLAT